MLLVELRCHAAHSTILSTVQPSTTQNNTVQYVGLHLSAYHIRGLLIRGESSVTTWPI